MSIGRFGRGTVGPVAAALAVLASLLTLVPAGAQTEVVTGECSVEREITEGVRSGVPAIAPGEAFVLRAELTATEPVDQVVLERPDGSQYIATYIEISALDDFDIDVTTAEVAVNGEATATERGTEPVDDAYVLHLVDADTVRLYPPLGGIAAAPDGTTSVTLGLADAIATTAIAGEEYDLAGCEVGASIADANHSSRPQPVSVAVAEPVLRLELAADAPAASPGGAVEWIATVENALEDATGDPAAAAHATAVTIGPLPDELAPLGVTGGALEVAGTTADGGWFDAGTRTVNWTIGTLPAGATRSFSLVTAISDALDPNDATELTLDATVRGQSIPDPDRAAVYEPPAQTDAIIVGVAPPVLTKAAGTTGTSVGGAVTWTITFTVPAHDEPLYNVVFHDTLGDGLLPAGGLFDSIDCTGCIASDTPSATFEPVELADGRTRVGFLIDEFAPNPNDRVVTIEYATQVDPLGQRSDGTPIAAGDVLTNAASISYNVVDRLGGAAVNLLAPPPADAAATDDAAVTIGEPALSIDKQIHTIDGSRLTWTIRLTNTGTADAENVVVRDVLPEGHELTDVGPDPYDDRNVDGDVIIDVPLVPTGSSVDVFVVTEGPTIATDPIDPVGSVVPSANVASVVSYEDGGGSVYDGGTIPAATALATQAVPWLEITKTIVSPDNGVVAQGKELTHRITVTNVGTAPAHDIQIYDDQRTGWNVYTGPTNAWWGGDNEHLVFGLYDPLAPGASVVVDYTVMSYNDAETFTTAAHATWVDGDDRSEVTLDDGTPLPFETDEQPTDIVLYVPSVDIAVTPDAVDNALVAANGQATFLVRVSNPNPGPVHNVEIWTELPDTLTYASETYDVSPPPVAPEPLQGTGNLWIGSSQPGWRINTIEAGATLTISMVVDQNGVPSDWTLVATANAWVDNFGTTLVDDSGQVEFVPDLATPVAAKSVTPDAGPPGEELTFTLDLTVEANVVDLYDVVFIDWMPDGLEFGGVVGLPQCLSVSCTRPPTFVQQQATNPDGSVTVAWFFGDVPAGAETETWRVQYSSRVATVFSGFGIPPDGVGVQDGLGDEPFVNRIRAAFNTSDQFSDVASLPSLPTTGTTSPSWSMRGVSATEAVDVVTPYITTTTTLPSRDTFTWENNLGHPEVSYGLDIADVADAELAVCNTGSGDAYAVEIDATMGDDAVAQIAGITAPAGVSIIDGWTPADPAVTLRIDHLPTGGCETVSFALTAPEAADLNAGLGGWPQDAHVIDLAVAAASYRATPTPTPTSLIYDGFHDEPAQVFVFAPVLHGDVPCVDPLDAGDTYWFSLRLSNGQGALITPDNYASLGVGAASDIRLEVTIPPNFETDPNDGYTAWGWYFGATTSSHLYPDSWETTDDGLVLTFLLNDFPLYDDNSPEWLGIGFSGTVASDWTASSQPTWTVTGVDVTGSRNRGTASGHQYDYADHGGGLCGGLGATKWPKVGATGSRYAFRPDEAFVWDGNWSINIFGESFGAATTAVDTMPRGSQYTPNTAIFRVERLDGSSETLIAGDGTISETIVDLGDGRQRITWTGFGEHVSVSYGIPAVVDATQTDLVDERISNVIEVTDPDFALDYEGSCGGPLLCDTGSVLILDPNSPSVGLAVDTEDVPTNWGATRLWTVDVTIPADSYFENSWVDVITTSDDWPGHAMLDPTHVTVTCVSGCDAGTPTDIVPVPLPAVPDWSGPNAHRLGWWLGDIEAHAQERVLEFTFTTLSQNSEDFGGTTGGFGEIAFEATANVNWDRTIDFDPVEPIADQSWFDYLQSQCSSCVAGPESRGSLLLGFPEIEVATNCASLTGSAYIRATLPGSPNLRCVVEVTNTARTSAWGVTVRSTPDATGFLYDIPNDIYAQSTDLSWDLLSATSDAPQPPTTSWADSGGTHVEWAFDDFEELAGESTWTFTLDYRVAPTTTPGGTGWSIEIEHDTAVGFKDRPAAAVAFDPHHSDAEVSFVNPTAFVDKLADATPLWQANNWYGGGQEAVERFWLSGRDAFDSSPNGFPILTDQNMTWKITAFLPDPSFVDRVIIDDQLPYGTEIVPGSVRLLTLREQPDDDFSLNDIIEVPLPDPTVSGSETGTCENAFVSGEYQPAGNYSGRVARWDFSPTSAAPMNAPWNDTLDLYDNDYYASNYGHANVSPGSWTTAIAIVYETYRTDSFADCWHGLFAVAENAATLNVLTDNGDTMTATAMAGSGDIDVFAANHGPANGGVLDGETAQFRTTVEWYYPMSANEDNDIAFGDWDYDLTGAQLGDIRVQQRVTDHGHFDPATPPAVTVLPPASTEQAPIPLVPGDDFTWTWTRVDATSVDIEVVVTRLPAGGQDLALAGPENSFGLDPSRLQIDVVVPVPLGTADGTLFASEATITTGPFFEGAAMYVDGFAPTLTPSFLWVVNPAAPPDPSKTVDTGTGVTVGGANVFDVELVLPAGAVWFDLHYVDTLPVDLAFVEFAGSTCTFDDGRACALDVVELPPQNPDGADIGWWLGDVATAAEDRTVTLSYVASVRDDAANATFHNRVIGYADEQDVIDTTPDTIPNPGPLASDPAVLSLTVVEPEIVAALDGVPSAVPTGAGDDVTYTLTVTNVGDGPAYDVAVLSAINEALDSVGGTGASLAWLAAGWTGVDRSLTWSIPRIDAGESVVLTYDGSVDPGFEAAGLATVATDVQVDYRSAPEGQGRAYPSVRLADHVPLDAPQLALGVTAGVCPGGTEPPEGTHAWCVEITNDGSKDATDVTAQVTLPLHWEYVAGSAAVDGVAVEPPVAGTPSVLTWDLATLGADANPIYVEFHARPSELANHVSTVRASVTSTYASGDVADPGAAGYTAYGQAGIVLPTPGLNLTKSAAAARIELTDAGAVVRWTVTVANGGAVDLTNVVITETPADGLDLVDITAGADCVGASVLHLDPDNAAIAVDVPAGTACAFDVASIVGSGSTPGDVINDVEAAHFATASVVAQAGVDVWTPVELGDRVWFDENANGIQDTDESGAPNVTVRVVGTDRWGEAFEAATTTDDDGNWQVVAPPGTYHVEVPSAPSGYVLTVANADETADGPVVGASWRDSDADPATGRTGLFVLSDGASRSDIDIGFAPPSTNVRIVKTVDQPQLTSGEAAVWTLTVTNDGPGAVADALTVVDDVPAGLDIVDVPSACAVEGQLVRCEIGGLDAGGSVELTIHTNARELGSFTNTATVAAPSIADADLSDNTDSAVLEVIAPESTEPDEPPPALAFSGTSTARPLATTASLAVLLGLVFVVWSRRRLRVHTTTE